MMRVMRVVRISSFVVITLLALPTLLLAQSNEPVGGPVPDADASPFAAISTPAAGTSAHNARAPSSIAVPLTGEITMDGMLSEPIWQSAPAITQFHQKAPEETRSSRWAISTSGGTREPCLKRRPTTSS